MRRGARTRARHAMTLVVLAAAVTGASGCGLTSQHTNVVNGKQQFVSKCGTCHTLARAGTKGTAGPNLDESFTRARQDGLENSTFTGIVEGQITHPSRIAQVDPQTGKQLPMMPANLV